MFRNEQVFFLQNFFQKIATHFYQTEQLEIVMVISINKGENKYDEKNIVTKRFEWRNFNL